MAQILKNIDKMDDDIQFDTLLNKRNQVKFGLVASKEQALRTVTRQIPVQLLALEWLNKIDASIETRAYLVENFLPILVLGCEKILKEAQNKNLLLENKKDVNFNPINQLAQYLMRNNPKYNNNNETSAYVRTMREVYQELREQMFAFQENKLAKVKADVRKRRSERERIEKARELELERRKLKLEDIFNSFRVTPSGRIEIAIVLETIKIYNDYVSRMPDSLRNSLQLKQNAWPSFCYDRSDLNVLKRLLKHEYANVMNAFTENMTSEYFDLFIEFIEQCALYYVQLANRVTLNRLLVKLFHLIDITKTGYLIRRRLIPVFQAFEKEEVNSRPSQLRSAMEWPLLDPFIKFENKLEEIKTSPDLLVEDTRAETSIDLVVESAVNQPASRINESLPADDAKTTDGNETINDEASSIAQDNDRQLERTNTINNDTTLETTINVREKSKVTEKNSKPKYTYEELFTPMKIKLDKNNELQFLKGGSLYFKPIESLFNSFDVSLLKLNPLYSVVQYDELHEFSTEFVDSKQFLNMINNFVQPSFCFSEIFVNNLILFIKNNYTESLVEKNLKLEKLAEENKSKQLFQKYSACFDRMDNDASGFIDFEQLTHMFETYRDGFFKDYVEKAKAKLQPDIMLNNQPDQYINKDEFIQFLTILLNLADLPKLQDQIIQLCMSSAQRTYDDKARGETRRKWLDQMKNIGDITFGSLEPLYKHLFLVLLKDSENHGNSKNISAYVSVLDKKDREIVLKYQASTPQDSKYLLGKTLSRHTKNTSFKVIDTGKFVHVSRVQTEPNVHLFNPENKNNGSLALYPLKYTRNKTFGVLGIDTLQEKSKKNYFSDHELSFYQGVATIFGKSYANIVFKNRLGKLISSAVEWLSQRAKKIEFYNAYAVQVLDNETRLMPDEVNDTNSADQNEKKPIKINLKQILKCIINSDKLEDILQPDDTLESNHKSGSCVYECAVTSESTVEMFNSRTTYCFPLRNEEHKTVFVIEMTTKENIENIQKIDPDYEQIETVIYVLHKCQEELLEENLLGIDKNKYDLENQFEQEKFEILFEKVYMEVILGRLENFMDQPLESSDPELIKLISDVVGLKEFYSEQAINKSLIDKLSSFDPTLDTPFKRTESKYKIISQEVLKELHGLYLNTNKENLKQRLLVDWCCLIKNMKNKTEKIRANN